MRRQSKENGGDIDAGQGLNLAKVFVKLANEMLGVGGVVTVEAAAGD